MSCCIAARQRRSVELSSQPALDRADHVILLLARKLSAWSNPVPLREARPAAGCGRMLRDEHRVTAPRRLLPIIERCRRSEALPDQVPSVDQDRRETSPFEICPVLVSQPKLASESRCSEPRKDFIEITHPLQMVLSTANASAASRPRWQGRKQPRSRGTSENGRARDR